MMIARAGEKDPARTAQATAMTVRRAPAPRLQVTPRRRALADMSIPLLSLSFGPGATDARSSTDGSFLHPSERQPRIGEDRIVARRVMCAPEVGPVEIVRSAIEM